MQIAAAVFLALVFALLFLNRRRIPEDLQAAANVGSIVAALAAILIFVIPLSESQGDSGSSLATAAATSSATSVIAPTLAPLGTLVYSNDFEGLAGPEWSSNRISASPTGRRFAGRFFSESVTLRISSLPPHSSVTVTFDLYVLDSWDGDGKTQGGTSHGSGPDMWEIALERGPTIFRTTFSNLDEFDWWQSYPDALDDGRHPAYTGAAEIDTLGYAYYGDSVYRLTFMFPHESSELALVFSASTVQQVRDESWGIDNLRIGVSR